jgi:predicted nuclease of predicted toxin-antitoxin system
MDENVPGAITEALKKRGLDILTVQEDGLTSAPDPVVFKRAIELGRVVFSEDQDFLVEAKRYQMEGLPFPGVIFARQRIVSIGDCVRDLELIMSAGSPEDLANSVQYLPL